jgi:undecaprenyl-diphosphatase
MENLRNPALIGIMLILMGMVLYVADKMGKREINVENIGLKRGVIVGLSQALAVIPGVSRSGITMSVGSLLP